MVGYTYNTNAIVLAERLAGMTPGKGDKKVAFGLSGSDSADAALKMARYSTKKSWAITFIGAYHGQTYGSASLSEFQGSLKKDMGPFMSNIVAVPYPDSYRNPWNIDGYRDPERLTQATIRYIETYILGHVVPNDDVTVIMVEPIQGDGGTLIPPPNFLGELRRICDKYGILLALDEVQTGIGRIGTWFGIDHFGVEPDIMMLGKGLASGMGLSAVVARGDIADIPSGSLLLTSAANPVVSSAALATLDIIEQEHLLEYSREVGQLLMQRFAALMEKYPIIGDVRGTGLMIAVDIVKDRQTKEPDREMTGRICWRAFELGLILASIGFFGNCLRIVPPLILTKELAETGVDIIDQAIVDVLSGKAQKAAATWS